MSTTILKNATLPAALLGRAAGGLSLYDIGITEGKISAIAPAGSLPGEGRDLDGGLVFPAFVDIHTHLDKGHIWPRKSNPDGTFMSALDAVGNDRRGRWSASDVVRRMDFALRAAYAHGTSAIRTHIDSVPPQHTISWDVFTEVRARWAGRVDLQGVALMGPDNMSDRAVVLDVAKRVKDAGGILGGAIAVWPDAAEAIRNVVTIAADHGLDVDLHCDETLDPASSALRHLADIVIETGFKGRVVAGHCCVLSRQDAAIATATIERVAEAGIAVVSLPMCNMYLQDRDQAGVRTPQIRGITLVKELKAAGVPVALASDNTRDPFYAYGDLDALEVLREGARIVHFDHPMAEAFDWARTVGADAADIAGFSGRGRIEIGAPADLVLMRARSWTELMARPQSDRIVLRDGVAIDTSLPDYRELDDLMEA